MPSCFACCRSDPYAETAGETWITEQPTRHFITLAFLGLEGAGSTSVIAALCTQPAPPRDAKDARSSTHRRPGRSRVTPAPCAHAELLSPPPTRNLQKSTVHMSELDAIAMDVPGHKRAREKWSRSLVRSDGVVMVVDSADDLRFPIVRQELHRLAPVLAATGAPLLVLATKQDLYGAANVETLAERLRLRNTLGELQKNGGWALRVCSAKDPSSCIAAVGWLTDSLLGSVTPSPNSTVGFGATGLHSFSALMFGRWGQRNGEVSA